MAVRDDIPTILPTNAQEAVQQHPHSASKDLQATVGPMTAASNTAIDRIFSIAGFSELPAGEELGPFTIIEMIGEGGFGAVYLAQQTEPIRRRVAIKVIKPGMDSAEVLSRFETERHALALIDHPHVARVYDAGVSRAGLPFFAMEYVPGKSITRYCDDEQLNIPQRLDLVIRVCQAVQHAHQKGIIHRDLKPGNILITLVDGIPTPKVIDFGIAKATTESLAEKPCYTSAGRLMGTPEYMSPEQASHAGSTGADIDTRTDIYAIGVILYELLCGVLPFDSKLLREGGFSNVIQILTLQTPARPSERLTHAPHPRTPRHTSLLEKTVRGDLDWITMKAIEKERDSRYESANALAADLRRYLSGEPVLAGPPSALYRFSKFAKRNRAAFSAALATLLALICGTAASMYGLFEARKERDVAQFHQRNAEIAALFADEKQREALLAKEESATQRDLARDALAQSQRQQGELLQAKQQVEASQNNLRFNIAQAALQRFDVSTAARQLLACDPASRTYEWYLLAARLDDSSAILLNPDEVPEALAFPHSPNSLIVASNKLIHYNLADGTIKATFTGSRATLRSGAFQSLAISPDGLTLAAVRARADALELYDIPSASLRHRIPLTAPTLSQSPALTSPREAATPGGLSFSPDGTWLVASGKQVNLIHLPTRSIARSFTPTAFARAAAFRPQPQNAPRAPTQLAIATSDAILTLYNISNPLAQPIVTQLPDAPASLAFSPTGDTLAVGLSSSSVAPLYRTADLSLIQSFDTRGPDTSYIAFSPDGSLLAAGARTGPISVWSLVTRVHLTTLLGHASINSLAFAPTGLTIATTGSPGCCKLWNLEDVNDHLLPPGSKQRPLYARLARDGRTLAAIDGDWQGTLLSFPTSENSASSPTSIIASTSRPWYIALSDLAPRFLLATPTGSLTIRDLHSGDIVRDFPTSSPPYIGGALSSDGQLVAAIRADGTLTLSHVATAKPVFTYPLAPSRIVPAAFSPDGSTLAVCNSGSVTLFNLRDPQALPATLDLPDTRDTRSAFISFDPASRRLLALWENGAAHCWDVASRTSLWSRPGDRFSTFLYSVSFSSDGVRALILGQYFQSSTVSLIDAATGRELTQWPTDGLDPVIGATFVPQPQPGNTASSLPADDEIVLVHSSLLRRRFSTARGHEFEIASDLRAKASQLWDQLRRAHRSERTTPDTGLLTLLSEGATQSLRSDTASLYFDALADPSLQPALKRALTLYLLESR